MCYLLGYSDLLCLMSRVNNSMLLLELGSFIVYYRKVLFYEPILEKGSLAEKRLIRSAVHLLSLSKFICSALS